MNELLLQIPVIGMEVEQFLLLLITALAGGAFGAAIGALPAFIFTGFVVFLGEGLAILNRGIASSAASDVGYVSVTGVIGFGAITGPHIAFAGGVAASAYAAKKYPEMKPGEGGYHFGKGITYAFGTKPDILAVGAIFGVIGMLFTQLANGLFSNVLGMSPPTDFIAVSVFATAFLARPVFGYPLIGKPAGDGYLDMSPFERDEMHPEADTDGEHAGRPATEPWLPHQYKWSGIMAIGLVGGILRRVHLAADGEHLPRLRHLCHQPAVPQPRRRENPRDSPHHATRRCRRGRGRPCRRQRGRVAGGWHLRRAQRPRR